MQFHIDVRLTDVVAGQYHVDFQVVLIRRLVRGEVVFLGFD